jgi:hypothetical protein
MVTSLLLVAQIGVLALFLTVLFDIWQLYRSSSINGSRSCAERFSNGDDNPVKIYVESDYPFIVNLEVIDEIPAIFLQNIPRFLLPCLWEIHKYLCLHLEKPPF